MYTINNNNKLKVAIYLRLSNEDKDKINKLDDSESIKNQRNLLLSEIEKHKEFILIDEYCDEDLSGAGTYRPEFERLIKDCETGKIDIVLCKSQSRFSRDIEIIEKYIHNKFIEWNIRFISLTDNADTADYNNKKSRQINGLINEWYLEDLSNNIRSAFKAKMKQGEYISPFASFGYEIDPHNNNKLIIDPIAANIVKEIYNLYLKGLGLTKIAKYLNNNKIPSPSLYKYQKGIKLNIISNRPREQIKWSANAIKKILTNELYIGNLIQGKRTTISYKNHKIKKKNSTEWIKKENTHEAIINKEIFQKVQHNIKERTKPLKKNGNIHNFSGKVFCLECKHYMKKKNTNKYEYLVCSNNKDGYEDCNNKSSIRYDILEKIILTQINKKIEKYFDKIILNNIKNKEKYNSTKETINLLKKHKENLEKKLSETTKYLKSLYEDKVNNIITLYQFKNLKKEYEITKKMYNNQIKSINNAIKFNKNYISKNNNETYENYKNFNTLNRIIIEEFIEKIYISKINKTINERTIEIKWNFKD